MILGRRGEGELFTWGRRYFLYVSLIPAANPRLLATYPHVSSDLLLQIGLSVPTFQFRGRRENGRNSSAFKRNSPSTSRWKVKRLRPSRALKRTTFGSGGAWENTACCTLCWFFSPNIKGKISLCNILQHFNELLSSSDVGQVGDNNPLYLLTTKMSLGQIALLHSAVFEPRWIEMWVI